MTENQSTASDSTGSGVVLVTAGLTRRYKSGLLAPWRTALDAFDWTVQRGARIGVVGPNGSGKSTLLALAAGIEKPSSGSVRVFGEDPASGKVRGRIGYLPEDSPFPLELSAEQALLLCGAVRGLSGRDLRARARARLAQVGLAEHAKKPLGSYSRGMLRRFGLAQAVLHEPDLLLLDEPTAGLDGPGFEILDALCDEARARGATQIIATHLDLDLARCDELTLVVDGRRRAHGLAGELCADSRRRVLEFAELSPELEQDLTSRAEHAGAQLLSAHAARKTLADLYARHRTRAPQAAPRTSDDT